MFLARDRDRTFFSYLKYQVNNVKKIHAYADHDHDHATHEVLRYGTKNKISLPILENFRALVQSLYHIISFHFSDFFGFFSQKFEKDKKIQ